MGFLDLLLGRRPGAQKSGDPAIREIAAEICRRLSGLGLFVDSQTYGAFCEIRASTSPKLITTPDGTEASGVALLLAGKFDPPALVFEQINSLTPGLGRKMVGAAVEGLAARPGVLGCVRVNDLSPVGTDGRSWWRRVAAEHPRLDWRITHNPDATHWGRPVAPEPDLAHTPDFMRKREKLDALAREFGHDPGAVTLSLEKRTFPFLGQSFTSEGQASADGRVTIYYDPNMSDARLGCCLAHELQHLRYFVVRDAFRAEAADGPLHRRFERFTPELLAAQRGVSNYSNEHWDAWKGGAPPRLFSDELAEGGSEPINETIAEVAKALYNWGGDVRINPVWRELRAAVDDAHERLRRGQTANS